MRGSPFSRSVDSMGYGPSAKSKGFGKKAAMAAGVGAVAGMAVGYGLGRFPRPHFNFHSPQEEYYYNHYMYRRYGTHSTDKNDYGRDYQFKQTPVTYDDFMDNCMKRTDLLGGQSVPAHSNIQGDEGNMPEVNGAQGDDPNVGESTGSLTTPEADPVNETVTDTVNGTAYSNITEGSQVNPTTPPVLTAAGEKDDNGAAGNDDNDETVSIMEIGYPELIEQLKARRCVERYMVYSESFLEKQTAERKAPANSANNRESGNPKGSAEVQRPLCQGLVLLLTTSLMVLSSTHLLQ